MIGCYTNYRVVFTHMKQRFSPIVDDDLTFTDKPYIKTIIPLMRVSIKLVSQFLLNPMHAFNYLMFLDI